MEANSLTPIVSERTNKLILNMLESENDYYKNFALLMTEFADNNPRLVIKSNNISMYRGYLLYESESNAILVKCSEDENKVFISVTSVSRPSHYNILTIYPRSANLVVSGSEGVFNIDSQIKKDVACNFVKTEVNKSIKE